MPIMCFSWRLQCVRLWQCEVDTIIVLDEFEPVQEARSIAQARALAWWLTLLERAACP